jgi:hypothetical protein
MTSTNHFTRMLTVDYVIPAYAQSKLFVQGDTETVSVIGNQGMYQFATAPSVLLTLRWLDATGAALYVFEPQQESVAWDGQICVGGYIDAMHSYHAGGDKWITLLYLGGQPVQSADIPGSIRSQAILSDHNSDFHRGLASHLHETVTTWLVGSQSPLVAQAQAAMFRNARVHLFGQLASDDDPMVTQFALPLRLKAMTIFPP